MTKNQELTLTYLGERFRFANETSDVIIAACFSAELGRQIAVKGEARIDELLVNQDYLFLGNWTKYQNKRTGIAEEQFAFSSFVLVQPHNEKGIVDYLLQHGEGHGLGRVRAKHLWKSFGADAVKVFREQPGKIIESLAAAGLPIKPDSATAISAELTKLRDLEACAIELTGLLSGQGFSSSLVRQLIGRYGCRATEIVRRDPYKLLQFKFCGFKKCDALYLKLGLPRQRLKRQALSAWYAVAQNRSGSTWIHQRVATEGIQQNVGGAELRINRALELAIRGKLLGEIRTNGPFGEVVSLGGVSSGGFKWIAEASKADNEGVLAAKIADAGGENCLWQDDYSLPQISPHQSEQLALALAGPIGILGGSPGTGKTYTAAALIGRLIKQFGSSNIAIGCPTGKAAVRITEVMTRYGIQLRARTWHSLLMNPCTKKWHDEKSPLPYKILIGDETSMNDTNLMSAIFRAKASDTHILLVGDINQLPPVDHGAPLRDMILAGLPYGELREIKRNSGGIAESCAAIRDGLPWECGDNLHLAECLSPEKQIQKMLEIIHETATRENLDPLWECQPLCPVNDKSPISRKELNRILQAELNPNPAVGGSPFRKGDKIVNTKGNYFAAVEWDIGNEDVILDSRNQCYVANGELAKILEVADKYIIAKLESPDRTIRVSLGKSQATENANPDAEEKTATGCSWDLGYCLSVHKSQGSEWPVAITMIDEYPGARQVCSREWLYTAISRAKSESWLIGRKSTADAMCRRSALAGRKTFLREHILIEQSQRSMANL